MLCCKSACVAQSNVRDLSPGVALLFPEDTREKDMKIIKETCLTYVKDLKRRVSKEIPKLPFSRYCATVTWILYTYVT